MASRALEKLLPSLCEHLSGRLGCASHRAYNNPEQHAEVKVSYARWRRCFVVWRSLLNADVVLLALLLHSGCLWGPDYDALDDAIYTAGRGDPLSGANNSANSFLHRQWDERSVWALKVLHFLHLVEAYEVNSLSDETARRSGSRPDVIKHVEASSDSSDDSDERAAVSVRTVGHAKRRRSVTSRSFSDRKRPGVEKRHPATRASTTVHLSSELVPVFCTAGSSFNRTPAGDRAGGCDEIVTVTHADEPRIQQTAAELLDEWFRFIDDAASENARGTCFARQYFFSSALKFAAYVSDNTSALLGENLHIEALLLRQDVPQYTVEEHFHRSFPSILCCLMAEEVLSVATGNTLLTPPAAAIDRPLQLPPPVFLLPFHRLGKGSRVSICLTSAAHVASHESFLTTNSQGRPSRIESNGVRSAHVLTNSQNIRSLRGEAYTCEVLSSSMLLASDVGTPVDLRLRILLVDEAEMLLDKGRTKTLDTLLPSCSLSSCATSTSQVDAGRDLGPAYPGLATRYYAASADPLLGFLRVDHAVSRTLLMEDILARVPSSRSTSLYKSVVSRRREAGGVPGRGVSLQLVYGECPSEFCTADGSVVHVKGESRAALRPSVAHDALATIMQFLALTARRLLSLRGVHVATPPPPRCCQQEGTSTDVHDGLLAGSPGQAAKGIHDGEGTSCMSATTPFLSINRHVEPVPIEATVEALLDAAISTVLLSLTCSYSLPSSLMEKTSVRLWLTEMASFAVDASLACPTPVSRLLRGAAHALCVLPPRHQSLIVMVGLIATLGARHLESLHCVTLTTPNVLMASPFPTDVAMKCAHLWWSVFTTAVLRDDVLPCHFCPCTWTMVENVERSLAAAVAARCIRQSGSCISSDCATSGTPDTRAGTSRRLMLRRTCRLLCLKRAKKVDGIPSARHKSLAENYPVPHRSVSSNPRDRREPGQNTSSMATSASLSTTGTESVALCTYCSPASLSSAAPLVEVDDSPHQMTKCSPLLSAESASPADGSLWMGVITSLWVLLETSALSLRACGTTGVDKGRELL